MPKCEQCGNETSNKHFCSSVCYGLWQKGKSFIQQSKPTRPEKHCQIDGCGYPHSGKGYCRKHYVEFILGKKRYSVKKEQYKRTCEYCGKSFYGYDKSQDRKRRFCSPTCRNEAVKKPYIIKKGYKKILLKNHPRADQKGYVFEHILIAEATLGRSIASTEEIHHKDGNKINNSPENIVVCANHIEHMKKFHPTKIPRQVT